MTAAGDCSFTALFANMKQVYITAYVHMNRQKEKTIKTVPNTRARICNCGHKARTPNFVPSGFALRRSENKQVLEFLDALDAMESRVV